jgi:hypothetical protein
MSYEEFLEAIARYADKLSLPLVKKGEKPVILTKE